MSEEIEAKWKQIRQRLAEQIEKHGQCIQMVHLTAEDPPDAQPFMYTIGNHGFGLPELLIVGTTSKTYADVLNRLGQIQRDRGQALAHEEIVDLGGKFPLRIVDAGALGRSEYATFVGFFYGSQVYDVRQVLIPDTQGRWPDAPGCDAPYRNQPILSKIARTTH